MSHENPASIVPGSMHVNGRGEKVFIQCKKLNPPWLTEQIQPIGGIKENDFCHLTFWSNGQYYRHKLSEFDLIREYKEPEVYEAYLILWSDGSRDVRSSSEEAKNTARILSDEGRVTWKIIKLTGTDENVVMGGGRTK